MYARIWKVTLLAFERSGCWALCDTVWFDYSHIPLCHGQGVTVAPVLLEC